MPGSPPSRDPLRSVDVLPHAAGEVVHEQTVRAFVPVPPNITETTVRAPMPVAPAQEQTVRAFVPTPPPIQPTAAELEAAAELETHEPHAPELELVDEESELEEVEPFDDGCASPPAAESSIDVKALVSELEAGLRDVPVPRSEQPTVPETAARPRREPPPRRPDPPAVVGEVAVVEAEPSDLFGLPPASTAPRSRPERKRPVERPASRRDDPPSVSGEVAVSSSRDEPEVAPPTADVVVMPMTGSGQISLMTASGAQPIMTSSGGYPAMPRSSSGSIPVPPSRVSTDAAGIPVLTESSGPLPVMTSRGEARDSVLLWGLAGALVVLAVGVVILMVSLLG